MGPILAIVLHGGVLRRLVLAYTGFSLAEWGSWIAILVVAYGVGGAGEVALAAVIQLVPATLVAPLAASLGDRFRRDRVLALSYGLQAAAMALIAGALVVGAPPPVIYALAAIVATSIVLTRPAHASLLPALSRTPAELTAANVATATVAALSLLVGPALTGLILVMSQPAAVFMAATLVLAGSAGLVARLGQHGHLPAAPRRRFVPKPEEHPRRTSGTARRIAVELGGGFAVLRREPGPRTVVALLAAADVVWGSVDVFIVVLALEVLAIGDSGVGFLTSALGAGGLVGVLFALSLVGRAHLARPFGLALVAWTLPLAAIALVPGPIVVVLLLAIAGAGRTLLEVAGRTMLQRTTPDHALSRVFGVLEGAHTGTIALGIVIVPPLIGLVGVEAALVAVGLSMPVLLALLWRPLERADGVGLPHLRELDLLRRTTLFAQLPPQTLERLSANLVSREVTEGTLIIQQGEPGDRFYLIGEGECEILVDGQLVRVQGPGSSFGEIALLRDVPRTASVRARTRLRLYSLARRPFLEAVTSSAHGLIAADEVIEARLIVSG
jgi:MFS family permease